MPRRVLIRRGRAGINRVDAVPGLPFGEQAGVRWLLNASVRDPGLFGNWIGLPGMLSDRFGVPRLLSEQIGFPRLLSDRFGVPRL